MLDRYFQNQAHIAGAASDFRCPDGCDAPGCTETDVVVEATLFDLIRLSLSLDISVSSLFLDYCRVGLQDSEFQRRYKRLLIKLKKPCRFLRENRCSVHGSKPLNCVLFPEFHHIKGLLPELGRLRVFRKFPCLKDAITVPDERRRVLKRLRRMSRKEEALSFYFLFGDPFFMVDIKPLTRCLKRNHPGKKCFSVRDYDELNLDLLKSNGIFNRMTERIFSLDNRTGMERLFEKLEDDGFMSPLLEQMTVPGFVHTVKENRVKKLKKTLQRSVVSPL